MKYNVDQAMASTASNTILPAGWCFLSGQKDSFVTVPLSVCMESFKIAGQQLI
jgi:hypothetical protein